MLCPYAVKPMCSLPAVLIPSTLLTGPVRTSASTRDPTQGSIRHPLHPSPFRRFLRLSWIRNLQNTRPTPFTPPPYSRSILYPNIFLLSNILSVFFYSFFFFS